MEDFLRGSSAKNPTPQGTQALQTYSPNLSPDEDHGEAHPAPPSSSGEASAWTPQFA